MAQILLFLESGLLWNTNESEKKLDGSESEGSIRESTEEPEGDAGDLQKASLEASTSSRTFE